MRTLIRLLSLTLLHSRGLRPFSHCALPPSPLTPLPRWGEGNRTPLSFSRLTSRYE